MQLIDTWKHSWKFTNVIINAALGVFDTVYVFWPQFQAVLSVETFAAINGVMAVAAIIARIVKQTSIAITAAEKEQLIVTTEQQPVKPA